MRVGLGWTPDCVQFNELSTNLKPNRMSHVWQGIWGTMKARWQCNINLQEICVDLVYCQLQRGHWKGLELWTSPIRALLRTKIPFRFMSLQLPCLCEKYLTADLNNLSFQFSATCLAAVKAVNSCQTTQFQVEKSKQTSGGYMPQCPQLQQWQEIRYWTRSLCLSFSKNAKWEQNNSIYDSHSPILLAQSTCL